MTPHNMAAATASHPQTNMIIVVARLIQASLHPVRGTHSLLNGQSSYPAVACY